MFGRERELAWMLEALPDGGLIQIVGPPGIGKSTLAREALAESSAVWLFLDPVATGSLEVALAAVLDVPAAGDSVAGALAEVHTLVLDGAEAHVEELVLCLPGWSGTTIVVTTRQRLPGGQVLELEPLAVPDAVALFLDIARRTSGIDLSAEVEVVEALVNRLEAWPLALELAASRMRLYAPAELLAAGPLAVIEATSAPGQGLSSALEASWSLLEPEEQMALSRIAQIAGRFQRDTFIEIAQSELGVLEALLDASLVRWEPVAHGRRYSLLEPIRQFALARLAPGDPAREHYATAVLTKAELAVPLTNGVDGAEAVTALRELSPDLEQLLSAPAPLACRAAIALATLAFARGPLDRAIEWVRSVPTPIPDDLVVPLAIAEADLSVRSGREQDALRCLDRIPATARSLRLRAMAHSGQLELERATTVLREALLLTEHDPIEAVQVRLSLGVVLHSRGQLAESQSFFEQGLERVRGLDRLDLEGQLLRYSTLPDFAMQASSTSHRLDRLRAALQRFDAIHNQRLAAKTLAMIAVVKTDMQADDALESTAQAEHACRRAGNQTMADQVLVFRAILLMEANDANGCRDALKRAGDAAHEPIAVQAQIIRGVWRARLGDVVTAMELLRAGRDRMAALGLAGERDVAECYMALIDGRPPSVEVEALPATAPLRRAVEIVELTAAGGVLQAQHLDMATQSMHLRLLLSIARGPRGMEVSGDGTWFRTPSGKRVDITRRRVLRRVLKAFAARSGTPLSAATLLELAWPGEKPTVESGRARVHVAVSELRRLGLRDALVTSDEHDGTCYTLRAAIRDPALGSDG